MLSVVVICSCREKKKSVVEMHAATAGTWLAVSTTGMAASVTSVKTATPPTLTKQQPERERHRNLGKPDKPYRKLNWRLDVSRA